MTTQTFKIVESKEAQRNGYYNREESGISIEYFEDEQEWKDEVVRRKGLAYSESFFACKIIPATIQTTFSVDVKIQEYKMETIKNIEQDIVVIWYIETTNTKIFINNIGLACFTFDNIQYELPYQEISLKCMRHAALLRHLLVKGINSDLAKQLAECWMLKYST